LTSGEVQQNYIARDMSLIDCNDTNGTRHPLAIDICGDNIDNNCDGQIDYKADGTQCTFCDHYQLSIPYGECKALEDFYISTN